jgi:hypothetical protein
MGKYKSDESSTVRCTAHIDYEKNLKYAEMFCRTVKKNLLRGMRVKISDSEHLTKALLFISWKPGLSEKKGNYATPIFLHQYTEDFKKTAENVLNFYMQTVIEHQSRNPEQMDFFQDRKV